MFVRDESFGEEGDYRKITFGTDALQITCSDSGATMTSVVFDGTEMTLGFDTLAEYRDSRYFGATVGRYGNRIYLLFGMAFYTLAKAVEFHDQEIYALTQLWLSGHTVKHLLAAAAALCVYVMLRRRAAIA